MRNYKSIQHLFLLIYRKYKTKSVEGYKIIQYLKLQNIPLFEALFRIHGTFLFYN